MTSSWLDTVPADGSADPFERRSAPRVAVRLDTRLRLAGFPAPLPARSADLGTGGVCVETPSRFVLAALHEVELELPSRRVTFAAEGCWQREAPALAGYRTGIRLLSAAPDVLNEIQAFVYYQVGQLSSFLARGTELGPLELDEAIDLALFSRIAVLPPRSCVYRQGVCGPGTEAAYFVRAGSVALEIRDPRERTFLLERVGVGGLFGGRALVAETAPPESAVTETQTVLLEIDRSTFAHLERTKPRTAARLMRAVIQKQTVNLAQLIEQASFRA